MLKRILILALLFPVFRTEAQEPFEPSTYIGFNGGNNLSRVAFMPKIKQDLLRSGSFGLVFRHISEPHIGLQFEVNYAGKGWFEKIDSVGTYKRNLTTIDIPVMAVFVAGTKTLRFAFTLGPYVSYLRHEKETIDMEDPYFRTYYGEPLFSKWEFGFTGGLAIELHTKIGAFGIRASYSHSLTNLFPLNVFSKPGVLPPTSIQYSTPLGLFPLSKNVYYFNASRGQVIHVGLSYFIKL